MKLYELTAEYEQLLELAENNESDVGPLALAIEDIHAQIQTKCAGIVKVLATLDGDAEACAKEAKRLSDKQKRLEANAEHLRGYIQRQLVDHGILKLKAETFSITVVENPERVVVVNESAVPAEYKRTKTEVLLDKKAILAAYKAHGECVPGTSIERGVRLLIK